MKDLFRVFRSEFKSKFVTGALITILVSVLIPLIGPLASGDIVANPGQSLANATKPQFGRMLGEGVTYSIMFRAFTALRDKSTLDKNRASYLVFNKHQVLAAKLCADVALYMVSIISLIVIGTVIITYKNHGAFDADYAQHVIVFAIAMICMYIVLSAGMRFFQSIFKDKVKMVVAIGTWILLIAGVYMIMSIVSGVVTSSKDVMMPDGKGGMKAISIKTWPIQEWISDHKLMISLIPFANLSTLSLVMYGALPMWTVAPLCVYSVIFIASIWKPMTGSLKEYLCA